MPPNPEKIADDLVQKATNVASAVRMEAEVAALELERHTKDIASKAETIISLAENKARSLVDSAAKDAVNLVDIARQSAAKLYDKPETPLLNLSVIVNDIGYIKKDVAEIKGKLEQNYVTKDQFAPVQKMVYGLAAALGIATIGALLKLVLKV